ncbi:MAG: hypothetical protein ACI9MF_002010 [Gammaproteobacteria bacterium]|jgi:hypothetical protein
MVSTDNDLKEELAFDYLKLRRYVGLLGMAMPWVLWFCGGLFFNIDLQPSMSAYAHTAMLPMFSGSLWVIGVFLIAYEGFHRSDDIIASIAGFAALGVSFFPTNFVDKHPCTFSWDAPLIHVISAGFYFGSLAYMSYFQFTKTNCKAGNIGPRKKRRNRVYRVSAIVMVGAVVALIVENIFVVKPESLPNAMFWAEAIAISAFGVAWYVKGEGFKRWMGDEA